MTPGRLPSTDLSARSLPIGRSALHGGDVRAHPYRRGSPLPSGLTSAAPSSRMPSSSQTPTRSSSLAPLVGLSAVAASGAGDLGMGGDLPISAHSAPTHSLPLPSLSPWSSQSSLQDGDDVDRRFSSYTPPDIPVANAFPSVPDRSLGATGISVEDIEVMLRAMSLDAERGTVLRFNQMHVNEKLTVLFMHVLRLSHDIKEVALHAVDTDRRLDHIENLSQRAWQPSKAQNKLFRSLVRHFLIKPISSYQTLPEYIKNYIVDNAKKLRLGLYLVDKTVKATVNECINDITTQMKSAFRKAVFASCNNKIPLHSFARNMVDNYHLPAIPADIPVAILGTMALMREIAEPLAKQPNSKKGDTGFWSGVQEELDNLYETFKSNDRYSNPEWLRWASDKVKEDARRFPVGRGRFAAATREELDQALGSSGNPENRDVDILGNGDGASHNGDQDMDEEDMDGDVELSAMGDVAATVQMDAA